MPNGFYVSNNNYMAAYDKIMNDSRVSSFNKKIVSDFVTRLKGEEISNGRIKKYLQILHTIMRVISKDFKDYKIQDLEKVIGYINEKGYSTLYRKDFKVTIKKFMKFFQGEKFNPERYKWISLKIKKNEEKSVTYNDLLTREEVNKIIKVTNNPMYKCLVSLGYESAMRPSELLSLTINNIKFEDGYAKINIQDSKTTSRTIFVKDADPYLKLWINSHPLKDDPAAPLFISKYAAYAEKKYLIPESYSKILRTLARNVGIKKRIYGYLLRHSRITHMLEEGWHETMIKKYVGQTVDSRAFRVYEHLAEKQLEEHAKKIWDKVKEEKKGKPKEEIECNICHTVNPLTNDFCLQCKRPISNEALMKVEKRKDEFEDFVVTFIQKAMETNPKLRKVALETAREKKIEWLFEEKQNS